MKRTSLTRQVHVRVPTNLKRAVKMFCVREGTTEQAWVHELIEERLKREAPDLWPDSDKGRPESRKSKVR